MLTLVCNSSHGYFRRICLGNALLSLLFPLLLLFASSLAQAIELPPGSIVECRRLLESTDPGNAQLEKAQSQFESAANEDDAALKADLARSRREAEAAQVAFEKAKAAVEKAQAETRDNEEAVRRQRFRLEKAESDLAEAQTRTKPYSQFNKPPKAQTAKELFAWAGWDIENHNASIKDAIQAMRKIETSGTLLSEEQLAFVSGIADPNWLFNGRKSEDLFFMAKRILANPPHPGDANSLFAWAGWNFFEYTEWRSAVWALERVGSSGLALTEEQLAKLRELASPEWKGYTNDFDWIRASAKRILADPPQPGDEKSLL